MPVQKRVIWGVGILAVIVLVAGVVMFFHHRSQQPSVKNCDQLTTLLKDHLKKDVFKQNFGGYQDIWTSSSYLGKSQCSYFSMRQDGKFMQGYHNSSGSPVNVYGSYTEDSDGVVNINEEKGTTSINVKLYPLFFTEPVMGSVWCSENDGEVEWRSVVSVRHSKPDHTDIKAAVDVFRTLSDKEVLLDNGDKYQAACFDSPSF